MRVDDLTRELLITSTAFGLFVVCPRMAGMVHIIAAHSPVSMLSMVLLGSLFSLPLLLLMVFVFEHFGVLGALAFCVVTDLGAAFVMKGISMKASLETLVIAVFVIIGVKAAPLISGFFVK